MFVAKYDLKRKSENGITLLPTIWNSKEKANYLFIYYFFPERKKKTNQKELPRG